jgi:hypothetical protein
VTVSWSVGSTATPEEELQRRRRSLHLAAQALTGHERLRGVDPVSLGAAERLNALRHD